MDPAYYYCKCSICFENDSEMEFINCGDQYCFPCLERYVEYWIKEGSWGLLPAELTCPVCGGDMLDDDWMPYISTKAMEMWRKFQLNRQESLKQLEVFRECPKCDHLQPLMGQKGVQNYVQMVESFENLGLKLVDALDATGYETWNCVFGIENILEMMKDCVGSDSDLIFDDEDDLQDFLDTSEELFEEFLTLLSNLKEMGLFNQDQLSLIRLLLEFGRMFLRLISFAINSFLNNFTEDHEEKYLNSSTEAQFRVLLINLQLNFQLNFSFGLCDVCGTEFCLPCHTENWFHPLHPTNSINTRPDGSKQCPRCFVRIEKDSDGCNEMRCNYCGTKFCWECGRKWSKDCGVYKCKKGIIIKDDNLMTIPYDHENNITNIPRSETLLPLNSSSLNSSSSTIYADAIEMVVERERERDPEIGVPNVHVLHHNRR